MEHSSITGNSSGPYPVLNAHIATSPEFPDDLVLDGLVIKSIETPSDSNPVLGYKLLQCKLGNNAVWQYLISHPAHAARVRSLEIIRENDVEAEDNWETLNAQSPEESIYSPNRQEIEQSECLLIGAIRNMSCLDSFIWDRWVPAINRGEEAFGRPGETYAEDIWIALREHTPLKKLHVVDLGRVHQSFSDARPIFSSSIFTLRNLTHLVFKMYYSPDNPKEGENGYDDESEDGLLPPRVRLERLRDMLSYCPHLETLNLTVIDRDFYWNAGGNPFTDASVIFSSLYFPELQTLILQDIIVKPNIMIDFLSNHSQLRTVYVSLSLAEDDLPETSFNLEKFDVLQQDILPNIQCLHLPSGDLRQIAKTLKQPSPLQELGILQPEDWDIGEDIELRHDEHYVPSLDEVWGSVSTEEEAEIDVLPFPGSDFLPFLVNEKLRKLTVENVTTLEQLTDLIDLTPHLEHVVFTGQEIPSTFYTAYTDYLPYLARWTHLLTLRATFLWPCDGYFLTAEETHAVIKDISIACPTLVELTWFDGRIARIIKSEDGEPHFELVGSC